VSPGYLDTLQIPLVAGRNFDASDEGRPVIIVNETMARQFWPDENPVGKTLLTAGGDGLIEHGATRARGTGAERGEPPASAREVIGVMKDSQVNSMGAISPFFYAPFSQWRTMPKLLIRSSDAAASGQLAQIVSRIDNRIRMETTPLASRLDERLREQRLGPLLAAILGAFALLLSTVGLSGVFAYAVRQRTREIGVRLALGAQPIAIVRLILAGASRAVAVGLGLGLIGAVTSSIVLRSRLYGMSPFDPIAYGGVVLILAVAGLAASYVPARRASLIDPLVALRCE
jgi:hypothetical protein